MFAESGVESIKIPSTLKVIETATFFKCENLKKVEFSKGLEKICAIAFSGSGIENIVFPSSVKIIGAGAFVLCKCLRSILLNEGLETLGTEELV